jgi:hypothetical protein
MELPDIQVKFPEPVSGYWDGGKKSGGTFVPEVRYQDNPEQSRVKWGCFELNFFFTQTLHREKGANKGKPFTHKEVTQRAKAYLRRILRVPNAIVQ